MANAILRTDNWRAEFIYQGASFGFWNRGETTFGSENTDVVDPEDGPTPLGGRQTADTVEINRPWKKIRDSNAYRVLKPLRGRGQGLLIIHELDEITGQPISSAPIDTLIVILADIKIPESDAGGNDHSTIACTLQVRP